MAERPDVELGTRSYRSRMWTYLLAAAVLVVAAIGVNFAFNNPEAARKGFDAVLGLPRWAFPVLGAALGAVIYWIGLRVETDAPEAIGAALIAGSIAGGEFLLGWKRFELGGLQVVPYLIPTVAFVVLMMVAMTRSK